MAVGVAPRGNASFLEVSAASLMQRGLQGSLAHALKTLSRGVLHRRSQEAAAVLAIFLHAVSLQRDGGTLGEALYAIKRSGIKSVAITAAVHGAVPYLENKLADMHAEVSELQSSGYPWESAPRLRRLWAYLMLRAWPSVKLSLGMHDVVQRIMYLTKYSKFPSLEHSLLEQPIERMTTHEWRRLRQVEGESRKRVMLKLTRDRPPSITRWLMQMYLRAKFFVADYSKTSVLGFVVIYKLLDWWYSKAEDAIKVSGKVLPEPPQTTPHENGTTLPKSKKCCPICRKARKNPAVLTVSGYVFCYTCLLQFVRVHHKCPITQIYAREEDVRRLYFT